MQLFRLFFAPDKETGGTGDSAPREEDYDYPPPPPEGEYAEEQEYAEGEEEYYPPLTPSQEEIYRQQGYEPLTPSQEEIYRQQEAEGYPPLTPSQEEIYRQQEAEGYPPLTPSQEEVYRQQEQQYAAESYPEEYADEDSQTPRMAHQFVVGAGYGEPVADDRDEITPIDGVVRSPVAASDPKYQQLSVGALPGKGGTTESMYPPPPPPLEFADPGSSNPEAEHQERNPFNQPSVSSLGAAGLAPHHHDDLLPEHDDEHAYGERPHYREQTFGQGIPAIDEDGIPRYIPALPVPVETGVRGRRICGMAWALFGAILGLVVLNAGIFSYGTLFFAPLLIVGLLLMTGAHWAGTFASVVAFLCFLLYNFAGYVIAYAPEGISLPPILTTLPPEFGITLMWFGFLLPVATLIMILGDSATPRAVAGAILLLAPTIALTIWVTTTTTIFRPKLAEPRGPIAAETITATGAGYSFTKPEGWVTYEWNKAKEISPLAQGVSSVPNYFFLNGNQDMMLAFHIDEAPRRTLASLLGQTVRTPIEEDLARNLPATQPTSKPFVFQGIEFQEVVYTGAVDTGARLSVTVVKGDLGNRTLIISLTRDMQSNRTTSEDADAVLNNVIGSLRIQ